MPNGKPAAEAPPFPGNRSDGPPHTFDGVNTLDFCQKVGGLVRVEPRRRAEAGGEQHVVFLVERLRLSAMMRRCSREACT